jgi:hypothetical protein
LTLKSDSTSIIASGIGSTIDLLEQCFPLMENRYLLCFNGEPWCILTMGAAIMLLKFHIKEESRLTAKSSFAKRFLDLHYKHLRLLHTSSAALRHSATSGTHIEVCVIPIYPKSLSDYVQHSDLVRAKRLFD